jgi:FKBP-type peptidyl-prolyl cis-trans isomerase FkpA
MGFWFRFILFLFVAAGLISCKNRPNDGETKNLSPDQLNEKLLEAYKTTVEFENKQIDKLITNSGWNMIETPTGLRYQILEKGNGPKITAGKFVQFEFEVKLINKETIYSSEQTGLKEFKVGSGGVESGLEEGILLLRVGDKARFIIPSYLAHGLSGDQDKIPPKATLIYTLKLIDFK